MVQENTKFNVSGRLNSMPSHHGVGPHSLFYSPGFAWRLLIPTGLILSSLGVPPWDAVGSLIPVAQGTAAADIRRRCSDERGYIQQFFNWQL